MLVGGRLSPVLGSETHLLQTTICASVTSSWPRRLVAPAFSPPTMKCSLTRLAVCAYFGRRPTVSPCILFSSLYLWYLLSSRPTIDQRACLKSGPGPTGSVGSFSLSSCLLGLGDARPSFGNPLVPNASIKTTGGLAPASNSLSLCAAKVLYRGYATSPEL